MLEYFYAGDTLGQGEALFIENQANGFNNQIRKLYLNGGYADVKVSGPTISFNGDRTRVTLHIEITEGPRYRIAGIKLVGDAPTAVENALAPLKGQLVGLAYFQRRKLLLKSVLLVEIGKLGYPDATVDVFAQKDSSSGDVTLEAKIITGDQVTIGDIKIQGNERTRSQFIQSRLKVSEGDPYNPVSRRESFNLLYQSGLFSRVKLKLLENNQGTDRTLLVDVEEKMSRDLHIESGWGSYEMIRLKGGFTDRNLFGMGRIFRAEGTGSLVGRYGLLGLTDPWLYDGTITGDTSLFYRFREEPSFTMEEAGSTLLFSKKLSRSVTGSLGYSYSRKDITQLDSELGPLSDTDNYILALSKIQFTGDTRNDFFSPTSGYRWHTSFELADSLLGGTLEFYRLTWGFRYFFPLGDTLTLGTRYQSGIILPSGSESTIPVGERFFNGGESSVRGFRESRLGPRDADGNPYGGTAYNIFNIELRKKIRQNVSTSVFFDLGNVAPNSTLADGTSPLTLGRTALIEATFQDYLRDMRPSYGVGFQYLTPIGPARLDFAFNPKVQGDDNSFLIHFSIGMAF